MRCVNCMKEFDEKYGLCPYCGHIIGTQAKEPFQLPPGTILSGRYLVGTAVGVGGFGITYRGWDNTLQQMIAIKEYYPSANGIVNRNPGEAKVIVYSGVREAEFEKGKERFLSEARNMAKFSSHPNIVHVYDYFQENGTAYITMEFLEGISYKDFIKMNGGKIALNTARDVTIAVLDALKEIHRIGIIHRDISPDNVFICSNSVIKLIDFGAARFSTGEEEKTLSVILKPGYAPPEQYQRRSRQGPWTDIYAVGAMFYRAITGRMPDESVNRMVKDEMPSPAELDPEIPENISTAIMRAMAVNQELRFRSADQFRAAIESKKPVRDVQGELKVRRGRRVGIVAAILGILIAAGGFGARIYYKKMQAEHLAPASITLWYPEGAYGENTFDAEQGLLKSYLEEYGNNVQVKAEGKPADSYETLLREAIAAGNAPTLFDSSCLEAGDTSGLAVLDEVTGRLETTEELKEYRFLPEYGTLFPEQRRMPLSFEIPVVYRNTGITPAAEKTILDRSGFEEILGFGNGYVTDPNAVDMYLRVKPDLSVQDDYERFVHQDEVDKSELDAEKTTQQELARIAMKDNAGYYLSDTGAYKRIQDDMPGIYGVLLLGGDLEVPVRFTNMWSISESASQEEKAAAARLIYYFLSQEDQLVLSVEKRAGLPLREEALDQYKKTYPEFDMIDESLENVRPEQ